MPSDPTTRNKMTLIIPTTTSCFRRVMLLPRCNADHSFFARLWRRHWHRNSASSDSRWGQLCLRREKQVEQECPHAAGEKEQQGHGDQHPHPTRDAAFRFAKVNGFVLLAIRRCG